ncbi:hypothetical protein [Pseudoxanthomonas dokdonensis]|uniref:Membrane protein n=1 Tax=Pseudoxanthomonas dokdonensis TaxID=344882 RepID=A0A0R0CQ51_9GAMM|nr:hypothetical protein [Pseudoxanthomonas dokdonensis]KRG72041.1 membrane protein [Pseudoxanthomonas dokdonensis]
MHWLFLVFSIGLLAVAIRTTSVALMAVCLLGSLGLLIAWVMGWYSARVGERGDTAQLIDPVELHRLRELAQARKQASSSGEPPPL